MLNITVRYVPENNEAFLSYAKDDMFALVFLINQGISEKNIEKTGEVVREIIDLALELDGSYYLPYYHYPTKEQMSTAYPTAEEFFQKKKEYDPEERFMNQFTRSTANEMGRYFQSLAILGSSLVFPFYLIFIKEVGGGFLQYGISYGLFTVSSALVHILVGNFHLVGRKLFC